MPRSLSLCPHCACPDVPLDRDGKITLHSQWRKTERGLEKLTTYCTTAIGLNPQESQ